MSIKTKLTIMNFLQFFVWGAWMITLASYGIGEKGWNSEEFGWVFSTMGFASLIMPTLFGIIADKWDAKYVYAIAHLLFGATMLFLPLLTTSTQFFWVLLIAMCFYMPTIALNNAIGFEMLLKEGKNPTTAFPPIRVFGTIGFIIAMWLTNFVTKDNETFFFPNLFNYKATISYSFYISAIGAIILSIYSLLALPNIKSTKVKSDEKITWIDKFGLRAFSLFKQKKMAIFFIFSLFLGGALQLTNAYGDKFLQDPTVFSTDSLINAWSTVIMSISQISETLFILSIPFFLKKFGIKKVMLISMSAWVIRFGLLGIAGNSVLGLILIITSCIVYGMAFDFFNISGALFVEKNVDSKIQSSAQGVFMFMTNGIGSVLGIIIASKIIDVYFKRPDKSIVWNLPDLSNVWFVFTGYALVITILFVIIFKYKHNPQEFEGFKH
jgi:nucleoside transporter